jgi:hypothetical protein
MKKKSVLDDIVHLNEAILTLNQEELNTPARKTLKEEDADFSLSRVKSDNSISKIFVEESRI